MREGGLGGRCIWEGGEYELAPLAQARRSHEPAHWPRAGSARAACPKCGKASACDGGSDGVGGRGVSPLQERLRQRTAQSSLESLQVPALQCPRFSTRTHTHIHTYTHTHILTSSHLASPCTAHPLPPLPPHPASAAVPSSPSPSAIGPCVPGLWFMRQSSFAPCSFQSRSPARPRTRPHARPPVCPLVLRSVLLPHLCKGRAGERGAS